MLSAIQYCFWIQGSFTFLSFVWGFYYFWSNPDEPVWGGLRERRFFWPWLHMSTCHTGAPVYEAARWSQTQPTVLLNTPRGPEVGDEKCIDLAPVEQDDLESYKFIYLLCGHWYSASNLEGMYKGNGTCSLCRECYFPMQVKWVQPRVHTPAAALLASNQLNEWVQCRLGPPWHVFQSRFVHLLSQFPGSSVERGNVSHDFTVGGSRESLTGHTKIKLWNCTSVLICPFYIHIINLDGRYTVRDIRKVPWDISHQQKKDFAKNIACMTPYAKKGGLAYFTAQLGHGDIMLLTTFATILKALVIHCVSTCHDCWGPMSLCMKKYRLFELDEVRNDEPFRVMSDLLQQFFIMLRSQ